MPVKTWTNHKLTEERFQWSHMTKTSLCKNRKNLKTNELNSLQQSKKRQKSLEKRENWFPQLSHYNKCLIFNNYTDIPHKRKKWPMLTNKINWQKQSQRKSTCFKLTRQWPLNHHLKKEIKKTTCKQKIKQEKLLKKRIYNSGAQKHNKNKKFTWGVQQQKWVGRRKNQWTWR